MRAVLLASALALACNGSPESVAQTANPDFRVERLFTHDGCTVYRFLDAGYRYFVRCDSGDARVEWRESNGKSSRDMDVPTAPPVRRPEEIR